MPVLRRFWGEQQVAWGEFECFNEDFLAETIL